MNSCIDFSIFGKEAVEVEKDSHHVYYMYIDVEDAFEAPIIYRCPGRINRASYDLGSIGADGVFGNTGPSWRDVFGRYDYSTDSDNLIFTNFGKGDDITNFEK